MENNINQYEEITLFSDFQDVKRTGLRGVAEDTRRIFQQEITDPKYSLSYLYKDGLDVGTTVLDGDELPAIVQVIDGDVLDVAERFSTFNPCILNFANGYMPGGGWLGEAVAQEECIARRSTLIKSIEKSPMYERNRQCDNVFGLDDMIYSPHVRVLKNAQYYRLAREFDIAVVTAAAVDLRGLYACNQRKLQQDIDNTMERRIAKLLDIMAVNEHRTIILGAWGCGAFRQDVHRVANYFYKVLFEQGYAYSFDNVIFAIYNDQPKLDVFKNVFATEIPEI